MYIKVTPKACALIAAVNAGLVKETENGDYDIEAFEAFWAEFSKNVQIGSKRTILSATRSAGRQLLSKLLER